jgi:DNA-binding XRE family transcriptional regulator
VVLLAPQQHRAPIAEVLTLKAHVADIIRHCDAVSSRLDALACELAHPSEIRRYFSMGQALRERRVLLGLTQKQIGKEAGVTGECVSWMERDKKSAPHTVACVVEALGRLEQAKESTT